MIARFIPWLDGVPLELLQRSMGHRTTAVVLNHYFRPGREDFLAVLVKAMPKMLGEGEKKPSAKDEMRRIIEGMTAKSLAKDRVRLLQLLARAQCKAETVRIWRTLTFTGEPGLVFDEFWIDVI